MSRCFRVALVLGCAGFVGGCASRAELQKVRQEMREARAMVADQQVAVDGLRRRMEMIRSEVTDKGKRPAGAAAAVDVNQKLAEIDARLAALEQGRPAEAALPEATPPAPPLGSRPTPPSSAAPQTNQELALAKEEGLQGARVDADYRDAVQLIRQGQCNQAVPKLRDFIRRNTKSDLADNAQFLIGSCYYGQRDFNRAIVELNEVLIKYPKADKVPAALLTLADAFADSGDKLDARLILQKLVSEHPRSDEAERGRQKLQSLGS